MKHLLHVILVWVCLLTKRSVPCVQLSFVEWFEDSASRFKQEHQPKVVWPQFIKGAIRYDILSHFVDGLKHG